MADDFKAVSDLLKRLEKEVPQQLNKTLIKNGLRIEREAKKIVPVDTGRLKNSIKTQQIEENEVEVGTNVEYAVDVEFGSPNRRPKPYLFPALDIVKPKLLKDLAALIGGLK